MCRRYCFREPANLAHTHGVHQIQSSLCPRYNIAPDDLTTTIYDDLPGVAGTGVWGLRHTPFGTGGSGSCPGLTVGEFLQTEAAGTGRLRRCLLPADGYYEWPGDEEHGFPELFTLHGEGLFMFAGVWCDPPPGEMGMRRWALLLTNANGLVADTHSTMPVILLQREAVAWLNVGTPKSDLRDILAPLPTELMRRRLISCRLNAVPRH